MAKACDAGAGHNPANWNIYDSHMPELNAFDEFEEWPDGFCRYVYRADCVKAQLHASGWAMRSAAAKGKPNVFKKKCLGVVVCSLHCVSDTGCSVHLRPAYSNKRREKQEGKPCPNLGCLGSLQLQPCSGYCGFPVLNLWRRTDSAVFFQSEGFHDHPRPNVTPERPRVYMKRSAGLPDAGDIQSPGKERRGDLLYKLIKRNSPEHTSLPSFDQQFAPFLTSAYVMGNIAASGQCSCSRSESHCGVSTIEAAEAASQPQYRKAADPCGTATAVSPDFEMQCGSVLHVMDHTVTPEGPPLDTRHCSSQKHGAAFSVPAHSEAGEMYHVVMPVDDPAIDPPSSMLLDFGGVAENRRLHAAEHDSSAPIRQLDHKTGQTPAQRPFPDASKNFI
ncbi:hypothetical protein HPB48_006998 [Haemaphysalis longicornis]|uniref:GCM domain-containing protein n=1 Tax=Haemaphysalis longicornis TaxID=44386 RepID=A0A9J6FMK0_HAELO|nr:hypothetical protein HPB48_006998 [Haemaphysalis longicornis]